eukprot:765582-Hanusia_phi.AAC.1
MTTGNDNAGVMVTEIGGVNRFSQIKIEAKKGSISLMGLKWTDLAEGVTTGGWCGYLHWDNLYGDAVISNDLKVNGNVGIGTTPSATYNLDINGSLNCTGLYLNGSAINQSQWITSGEGSIYNNNASGYVGIGLNLLSVALQMEQDEFMLVNQQHTGEALNIMEAVRLQHL